MTPTIETGSCTIEGGRRLFSTFARNEGISVKLHTRQDVIAKREPQLRPWNINKRRSVFVQKGRINSSQLLLQSNALKNKVHTSELYIPKEKRKKLKELKKRTSSSKGFATATLPEDKTVQFDIDVL